MLYESASVFGFDPTAPRPHLYLGSIECLNVPAVPAAGRGLVREIPAILFYINFRRAGPTRMPGDPTLTSRHRPKELAHGSARFQNAFGHKLGEK